MKSVYQHCGRQHLHRYVAEFDFRYTNRIANGVDDTMRAARILKGAEGKRLPIGGLTRGRVPNQRYSRVGFQRLLKRLLNEIDR